MTLPGASRADPGETAPSRVTVTDDRSADGSSVVYPVVDLVRLEALAVHTLEMLGVGGPAELALTLVDVETIAELNRTHLGGSGPTDVLSFPLESGDADDALPAPPGVPRLLGDVVICPEIAAVNAPDHAGTFDDELALLCVHGILHVLGWDHAEPDDARAMRAEEARVLAVVHRPVAAGTEIPE